MYPVTEGYCTNSCICIKEKGGISSDNKENLFIFYIVICCILFFDSSKIVYAKNPVFEWKKSNGNYYYYDEKGKIVRGLQKIGKQYYYFNNRGEQRTGWRKIGNDYYFFHTENKAYGYMLKNRKVNGIVLRKNGKAYVTNSNRRRLNLMVRCQKVVDSLTKTSQTKSTKLKKIFLYVRNHPYRDLGDFQEYEPWDLYYVDCSIYKNLL